MELFNQRKQKTLRRKLRKNTTPQEVVLWAHLRKKQCRGFRFLRQYGVGPYIVDFYCPQKRLVIELDGSQHAELENQEYDKVRTDYLSGLGIKVLRFWNNEVDTNIDSVLEIISEYLS